MRVLMVNYEYPPLGGGGGVVTALLAQEFARTHQVTVLTSQGLGLPRESVEDGVQVLRVPVFFRKQQAAASIASMLAYIPAGIREGKRLLKNSQFDIINTHFALPSGPVGDSLGRSGGLPNVLSVHGGDLYDPSKLTSPHRHPLLRGWIRRLLTRADAVVGQSNNTLDNLRAYYSSKVQSARIPLGIQRPRFAPASRDKFGFSDDEMLLVTVGRLVRRKAVEQLIATVQALDDKRVRLVVIGAGPEEGSLRQEAHERGVEGQVRFMGFVDMEEKFQLIEMSDIYVSTSQHEGFGLVFLEAMHCGLPIVCYDNGGQTDFLRSGETGYLVPLNQLEQFQEKTRQLIQNAELRKLMGRHNSAIVSEFYIDNCARQYEEVFGEVIARHAGRVPVGTV